MSTLKSNGNMMDLGKPEQFSKRTILKDVPYLISKLILRLVVTTWFDIREKMDIYINGIE